MKASCPHRQRLPVRAGDGGAILAEIALIHETMCDASLCSTGMRYGCVHPAARFERGANGAGRDTRVTHVDDELHVYIREFNSF